MDTDLISPGASRRSTHAHQPVLLHEVIAALQVRPAGIYVDGTFGRGGHSRALLAALGPPGRVLAFDKDPAAIAHAADLERHDTRFCAIHASSARLQQELAARGITQVDGILLDLGVSSPQLEEAARGFSFRAEGPLDMRMDNSQGQTAATWLAEASQAELTEVFKHYGEERYAPQVASAIVARRQQHSLDTTGQLAALVAAVVRTREPGQNPATRCFQAIRIYLNRELEDLALTLEASLPLLAPGGRLAVISFHSLEDRIVKRFMTTHSRADTLPHRLPVRSAEIPLPLLRPMGRIRASAAEITMNPRARSATLRIAERASLGGGARVYQRSHAVVYTAEGEEAAAGMKASE